MRILAINDISCIGKCSLTVTLPIISASGVTCDVLPTAILSTHTGGFVGYTFRDLSSDIKNILTHWKSLNIKFDIIISGYLGNIEQIEIVKNIKKEFLTDGGIMIVDPVLGDNGKLYSNFNKEFVDKMKTLCKEADYIVPNVTESCFLTDTDFETLNENYENLLKKLRLLCKSPLITGAEYKDKSSVYYLNNKKINFYSTKKIEGRFHGSGDVFTSAFACCLAKKLPINLAVKLSTDFTSNSVKQTAIDNTDRRFGLNFESQMYEFLTALKENS